VLPIAMHNLKAIIFDKDDTFMKDQVYSPSISVDLLFEDTVQSCKIFHDCGYFLFIISNQSGIERGYFNEQELLSNFIDFNNKLFLSNGFRIDGFFYCPHDPSSLCLCRKPNIGMYYQIKALFQIDTKNSFYIGDRLADIEFAQNAGLVPVIIHRPDYSYKHQSTYDDMDLIEQEEENEHVAIFPSLLSFSQTIEKFYKNNANFVL